MRVTLLLTLLAACDHYEVGNRVEPRVDGYDDAVLAEWRGRVEAAGRAWRDALGPGCGDPFPLSGDGPALPVTLHVPSEWEYGPGTIGFTPTGEYVEVKGPPPGRELGLLVDVVEHEYGHVIGLHHNDDPTSVMGPGAAAVPNADDAARARDLLGCAP